MLISFILDQSLFTPFVKAHKLVNHIIDYKDLIRQMTANYIVDILCQLCCYLYKLLIYPHFYHQ